MEACLQKVELKIIILGESFVGKSSLLRRYTMDNASLNDEQLNSTIGVDFAIKEILLENVSLKLKIWDTAGQERFRSLVQSYTRNADGVVAVYDVTKRNTFENLEYWVNQVNKHHPKPVIIIVGNKIDRDHREVTRSEGLQYSKEKGALFMETSVHYKQGIGHLFEKLARKILQNGIPKKQPELMVPVSQNSKNQADCLCA